jgi:bla regulator protein blaR1
MKIIQYLFSSEIIEALGWTLVHSLWQGALLAIILTILLLLMHHNSAQIKYFISFISLIGILVWSAVTFIHAYNYAKEKAVIRENIISSPGYIRAVLKQELSSQNYVEKEEKETLNLQMVKIRSFFQRNFNSICFLWIIGILILSFRLIGGFLYLRRIRNTHLIAINKEWIEKLNELADKLQIKRKINAFFSPYIKTPLSLGFFKPVLLFPVSVFTGFSTKEIEAIIAHELAHVIRHDYFFNVLQSMLEIFFFYNPAVWIISSQIRNERENSCDNIAIELTGDKVAFAKALAGVQVYQMEQERLAMAFSSSYGSILHRIKRLQKKITMKTNFIEGLIAVGIIITGLTLASFTFGDNTLAQVKAGYQSSELNNYRDSINKKTKKKYASQKVDSMIKATQQNMEKNEELESSQEMKELLEVALSEKDEEISAAMCEDINDVMMEINVDQIVRDAMNEASAALKAAHEEIDQDDIHSEMREAAREIETAKVEVEKEMHHEMENTDDIERESIKLGIESAKAGLEIASTVLENLPIEEIIEASLSGVAEALQTINETNFDSVYEENDLSKEDLKQLKEQMREKDKQLKEQMKQLEKQMEQLEKQLDE